MGQGLNDFGKVIGGVNNGNQGNLAVAWDGMGNMTYLGTLDTSDPQHALVAPESYANFINAGSQVVGGSNILVNGPNNSPVATFHAFLWKSGTMTDLGTLPGADQSTANGINSAGDVVGSAGLAACLTAACQNAPQHAFVYHAGTMVDLGNLAGDANLNSVANAIDDSGEIVGWSDVRAGTGNSTTVRAFLYVARMMYDLTSQLDRSSALASFVKLTDAVAINCNGWIAANGIDTRDTYRHAYLLIREGPPRTCS
jgi:probable HAF family extracellular repeat protein